MKQPNISSLKKYLSALKKSKKPYLTADDLSMIVGVYPEVITNCLSYFEPMLGMDTSFNLKELVPKIEKFIEDSSKKAPIVSPINQLSKEELKKYCSINDFIYKKMSIGGMVDKNAYLSDKDLETLLHLINEEKKRREK